MKAAVVGCGIGGMASAIALARRGVEVTVFEAFETPKPLGSGLLLQPSGLAALRTLGLEEQARAAGARIDRLDGRDLTGRRVMDLDYGLWRAGTHGVGIHRASLFDLLFGGLEREGVAVQTATPIATIDRFDRPALRADDGRVFEGFDLAVIADGSGSRLRSQVRPAARAPLYEWGAVWADCPDLDGAFTGALRQIYHGAEIMIGVLPIGGGRVSLFWSLPVADHDAFFEGDFEGWKRRVKGLWPKTAELLDHLPAVESFSRASYRDVVVGRWNREACLLIGDAAHGTSPQLGQGANLALIDAAELGLSIKTPVARTLSRYQARRRRQTALYQIVSRAITPMFQSRSRGWVWVRDWLFTPLTQAPVLRWFVAGGLTGTGRLGVTPKDLRV
jgi:2-polyprenyl-6-methoxyphenol hydroxylase-like FAD-dependent oxidoreductase